MVSFTVNQPRFCKAIQGGLSHYCLKAAPDIDLTKIAEIVTTILSRVTALILQSNQRIRLLQTRSGHSRYSGHCQKASNIGRP